MPVRRRIFYSWQSDTPNNVGRNFIQNSLERALRRIGKDETSEIEPVLDRDTSGIAGTPSITESIFEKIALCDVFVADVTIVNSPKEYTFLGFTFLRRDRRRRMTPNPNVLIELGFAITHVGWDRIILVQNTAFGSPDDLPFDLRGRRILTYTLHQPGEGAIQNERNELSQRLEVALKSSLELMDDPWKKPERWEPRWWGYWNQNVAAGYGGVLFIREVGSKHFFFHLNVYSGSHTGRVSGVAEFAGRYMAQAWIKNHNNAEPCRIEFRRKPEEPKVIEVVEIANCLEWHGAGTHFNGRFERQRESLFDLGFLNELDLQRLYEITGQYFRPMMDQFGRTGRTDVLDNFSAEAFSGSIGGLALYTAAIVMKGEQGQLWAAYIDKEVVRYFTTEPAYKRKLPLTIEDWRKGFKEKEVVFDSAVRIIPPD
jgi:hypothetical protein